MSTSRLVEELGRQIELTGARPVVIAIDGASASGKSTLAEHLAGRLDAGILHMDDFYRDESEAIRRSYDAAAGILRYFDWERLRDEALMPLRAGVPARFRPFDWQRGFGLGQVVAVDAAPVMIVEGVYSARPELRHLIDVTVLVTAADKVRRERRLQRHSPHEWQRRWDDAELLYFAAHHDFDYVVDGG